MSINDSRDSVSQIIHHVRTLTRRQAPFSDKLKDVTAELRTRRKQFLGSYVSIRRSVLSGAEIDDDIVSQLSEYLASRTVYYWYHKSEEAERFCFRFYRLTFYALASGKVSGECVDDILRLAEVLDTSIRVFVVAMQDMLPEDMVGELFDFTETSDKAFLSSSTFSEAVLGGICSFLGVLPDPLCEHE